MTLRSVLLSGSLTRSSPHPPPFGGFRVHRLACPPAVDRITPPSCCHAPGSRSRPQGLVPPKSPLRITRRCRLTSPDAPMGFESNTFRCLPRSGCARVPCTRFVPRLPTPGGVSPPESVEKAKFLGFVWLRVADAPPTRRSTAAGPARCQPEDCCASGPPDRPRRGEQDRSVAPARLPERIPDGEPRPAASVPEGPDGRRWNIPRDSPPCRSVAPEGARSPACHGAPKSTAAQYAAPKGWHRWFECCALLRGIRRSRLAMKQLLDTDLTTRKWDVGVPPGVPRRVTSDPLRDPRRVAKG